MYFAESRMAAFLDRPTVLVTIDDGPAAVAAGLGRVLARLDRDLLVLIDVGGDVLAHGDEPGLRSPLCDAIMLAAASALVAAGHPVLLGIFGIGCDAELTADQVLTRMAEVAAAGGLGRRAGADRRGRRAPGAVHRDGSRPKPAPRLSARFAGPAARSRSVPARARSQLSTVAALTFYLDVEVTFEIAGRLAQAVAGAAQPERGKRRAGGARGVDRARPGAVRPRRRG